MRLLQRLQRVCESPRAVPAVVCLAVVLYVPSLGSGLFADDHMHASMAVEDGERLRCMPHRPLDIFVFGDGTEAQRLAGQEEGLYGWWTAEGFKLAFFRPLSSLSHTLDLLLWPDEPWLMHLHSLAWYLLLLVAVHRLFRRWLPTPWVATLALALYALDDAHAFPVAWVAHRNALIAATFGTWSLVAHDRWRREGWRAGAAVGPALFGVSLLAGESAVAVGAWLLAYSVTLDPARRVRRLAPLAAYAVVGVGYLAIYRALGYGTVGSGVYTDPLGDPVDFARRVAEYVPVLLQAQLGAIPADLWIGLPSPGRLIVGLPLCLAFLGWLAALVWPLRDRTEVRFFALGMVLACVPISATFPSDRLLLFVGLGGASLVAVLLASAAEEAPARRHARLLIGALAVAHVVIGPLSVPVDARVVTVLRTAVERADAGLPSHPGVEQETVVVVRSPVEPITAYAPVHRAAAGTPRPAHWYTLIVTPHPTTVTRVDNRTLRVASQEGFLPGETEQLLRSARLPMPAGTRVELEAMTVEVIETTPEGRPLAIEARFAVPLESAGLRFYGFEGLSFAPMTLPAVGDAVELPFVDPLAVLLGWE